MTNRAAYRELNESKYLQFQTRLLKFKGEQLQREFLESAMDNEDFVSFLVEQVATDEGNPLPTFDGPLTEASFKEPTPDQELRMYEIWRDAPPRAACRVSFWASVTLEHIKDGKIAQASWLAASGGSTETGEERIEKALSLSNNEGNRAVDGCVRTVFRRMSGLPAARGNRSRLCEPYVWARLVAGTDSWPYC